MTGETMRNETLPRLLLDRAEALSAKVAIREKHRGIWRDLDWQAYAEEAMALAAALADRSLARGQHVLLIGDNRPRLLQAMAAVHSLGAVAVPVFPDSTADEVAAVLQATAATHAVAEDQEQVDKLLAVLPTCPALRCIIYDDQRSMGHYRQQELVHHEALLDEGRAILQQNPGAVRQTIMRGEGSDPAFVFYTSGTGGTPRGAIMSHAALIDRARAAIAADGLTAADSTIAYLPPGWMAQTLVSYVQPLVAGYAVCCPESSDTLLADLREVAPSYFLTTPRMLDTIVSQVSLRLEESGGLNLRLYRRAVALAQRVGSRQLAGEAVPLGDRLAASVFEVLIYGPLRDALGMSRVRAAYSAGDAIDPSVLRFFRALGVNLKQLYGTVETGFHVATHRDGAVRPDTVGLPVAGVAVSVAPDGEILVTSPGLFSGYLGDAGASAAALDSAGRFRTGDLGAMTDDGQLRVLDRKADIGTLANGLRYPPRVIENRVKFSPYVREAITVGTGQDALCAMVDINTAAVGHWADSHNLPYTGHADLASRDEVYALVAGWLAEVNAALAEDPELAGCEIRRFLLLPEELDADDGVLTRTGKLRRGAIAERFAPQIAALFDGASEVPYAFRSAAHHAGDADVHSVKLRAVSAVADARTRRAA
jgi:long-chain acyl-CoA synthetase